MKKTNKYIILISVLTVLLVAISCAVLYADRMVTSIADKQLKQYLNNDSTINLTYHKLQIKLLEGSLSIDSINYRKALVQQPTDKQPGQWLKIDNVQIKGINWLKLRKKQLKISAIEINNPSLQLNLPKKTPTEKNTKQSNNNIATYISDLSVGKISLNNSKLNFRNLANKLSVSTNDLYLELNDICYNFIDSALIYSDSEYRFILGKTNITTTDGLLAVALTHAETQNEGKITIDNLRVKHTVEKEKLADIKKDQVTWFDINIAQVKTSPVAIIKHINDKKVEVENVNVNGKEFIIYRDVHYPAKAPYGMPQEALTSISLPFDIKHIKVNIPLFVTNMTRDGKHVGILPMRKINIDIADVNNRNNNPIKVALNANIAAGTANVNLALNKDKENTFSFDGLISNMCADSLESFLRPIAGATMQCRLHEIKSSYKGDKTSATGSFCMQYDSLQVHIIKDESPLKQLAKNAGLINTFAPVVINKSNPRQKNQAPYECSVYALRDDKVNFVMYMFAPITDGIMHTVLGDVIYGMTKKKTNKKHNENQ